jgi:hypothetical protein
VCGPGNARDATELARREACVLVLLRCGGVPLLRLQNKWGQTANFGPRSKRHNELCAFMRGFEAAVGDGGGTTEGGADTGEALTDVADASDAASSRRGYARASGYAG